MKGLSTALACLGLMVAFWTVDCAASSSSSSAHVAARHQAKATEARRLDGDHESDSGFRIVMAPQSSGLTSPPKSLDGGEYRHVEALFGVPPYGSTLRGILVYATPATEGPQASGCPEVAQDGSMSGYPKPFWPDGEQAVFMIDRGECHFVEKVRYAEQLGASAVIIVDNVCLCNDYNIDGAGATWPAKCEALRPEATCEPFLPYMGDDGSGGNVNIPSYMVSHWDGQKFKDCLQNIASPTLSGTHCSSTDLTRSPIRVELEWRMPRPDGRVEWELWTSSIDNQGLKFKNEFHETAAIQLRENTQFTPRYFIFSGEQFKCNKDQCEAVGLQENCCADLKLCTNNGNYCAFDPDLNYGEGLSGYDVVQENLRQVRLHML